MPAPAAAPALIPAPDLEALAGRTAAALARLWDEMGMPPAARARFLAALSEGVVGLYNTAVDEQTAAAAALRTEVAQLQRDIADLQDALGLADGLVRAARARAAPRRALRLRLRLRPRARRRRHPRRPPPNPMQPSGAGQTLLSFRDALEQRRLAVQQVRRAPRARLRSRAQRSPSQPFADA